MHKVAQIVHWDQGPGPVTPWAHTGIKGSFPLPGEWAHAHWMTNVPQGTKIPDL